MDLSIVIPVKDEAGNIAPLVGEIGAALEPGGVEYEIVYVDDGSGDATAAEIVRLQTVNRRLRFVRHATSCGQRARRQDSWSKRRASKIANAVRRAMLHDDTPDTGCGLKLFPRALFLDLPFFDHQHRFLPALVLREGGIVRSLPVNHRPRERGASKYGVLDRLAVGITDLFG